MEIGTTRLHLSLLCLSVLVVGSLETSVPAIYIFGDSTADVGNNNILKHSTAKANFPPNGIDFVHHRATGRFSNGLITADFLAKKLGFKRSPAPFVSFTRAQPARRGVNFASAGSGILDATGSRFGERFPLWKQLEQFGLVRENFVEHMGAEATAKLFSKSVFVISTGSNDLVDFFAAHGPVSYTEKSAYIKSLVSTYKHQLQRLYELGARKIGVVSVPPTGCCPSQRLFNATGGCVDELNELSQMFYLATDAMLKDLSSDLKGLKYSLGNLFEMVADFFQHAPLLGFTELESACCGAGKFNAEMPCTSNATVCTNRKQYLFWDMFHPTQEACKIAAETLFSGPKQFVSPINFAQLAPPRFQILCSRCRVLAAEISIIVISVAIVEIPVAAPAVVGEDDGGGGGFGSFEGGGEGLKVWWSHSSPEISSTLIMVWISGSKP